MYKIKLSRLSVIAGCVMLMIALFACKGKTNSTMETDFSKDRAFMTRQDSIYKAKDDSLYMIAVLEKNRRDSTLINLGISEAQIRRDPEEAKRFLTTIDKDGILALWAVHHYFSWGKTIKDDISAYEVINKIQTYIGIKRESMDTWEASIKKSVKKFSPALSVKERSNVSKSLSVNATLIDSLVKLTDKDLFTITNLLDTIASYQSKNTDWIYSKPAESPLLTEYNILKKVWDMPKLIQGGSTKEISSRQPEGHYYILGKFLETPFNNDQDYFLIWNTRYWNRYQYAIGMFHRRCLDAKAKSPQQKRNVAINMAKVMNEAAKMLEQ